MCSLGHRSPLSRLNAKMRRHLSIRAGINVLGGILTIQEVVSGSIAPKCTLRASEGIPIDDPAFDGVLKELFSVADPSADSAWG